MTVDRLLPNLTVVHLSVLDEKAFNLSFLPVSGILHHENLFYGVQMVGSSIIFSNLLATKEKYFLGEPIFHFPLRFCKFERTEGFIPLRVVPAESTPQATIGEIEYPCGVVIRFSGAVAAKVLLELLHLAGA